MKEEGMGRDWRRTSLTAGKRVAIVVVIVGALMIGVLKMAERFNTPIRLGLQDYLTQATGESAEITELKKVEFFPDLHLDMHGLLFRDPAASENITMTIERLEVRKGFFNAISIKTFELENMEVASGAFLPENLILDFAGIADPDKSQAAQFLLDGQYNGLDLLVTAQMDRHGGKPPYAYDFDREFPITFKLGENEAVAVFMRGGDHVTLRDGTFSQGRHQGRFEITCLVYKPFALDIKGELNGAAFSGTTSREGDVPVLRVTLEKADLESAAALEDFVGKLKTDLGLDGDDAPLLITTGMETARNDLQNKEIVSE